MNAQLLTAALLLAGVVGAAEPKPFFNLRQQRPEYSGPGGDTSDADNIQEVRLGYFGPADPAHPDGGDLWHAAQLAIEEANAQGGYHGKPFRLLSAWSENPWGTGVAQLTRLVYEQKVWAIIGGIDGPSTHLAEQVTVKTRLTLISPVATDKTVNLTNVPWMFSLVPGDHLQAPLLADAIQHEVARGSFVLVSADDHDSRLFAKELSQQFRKRKLAPQFHFKHNAATGDPARLADRVVHTQPATVVIIAGACDSARLLRAIRTAGFAGPVFGGPSFGRQRFLQEAGPAAQGARFPLLYSPSDPPSAFHTTFSKRFRHPPDYATAHTYDAVRLLLQAIRTAGLNRARVRDAVRSLSPWPGVTGTIRWDPTGSVIRPVQLGTVDQNVSSDSLRSPVLSHCQHWGAGPMRREVLLQAYTIALLVPQRNDKAQDTRGGIGDPHTSSPTRTSQLHRPDRTRAFP